MTAALHKDPTTSALAVFPVGIEWLPYGAAISTSILSRNRTDLKWAPTICGRLMRNDDGAVIAFATPAEAAGYAVDRIERESRIAEINVATYGWNPPDWRRGIVGPCLGYCPTLQAVQYAIWGGSLTTSRAAPAYERIRDLDDEE